MSIVCGMNELSSCRICRSSELVLLWELKSCPYGDLFKDTYEESLRVTPQPIELSKCIKCGLVQLLRQTDIHSQYDNYIYQTKVTKGLNKFYDGLVRKLIAEYPEVKSDNGFVLDIGSNDGSFLEFFRKIGISTLGVEPSESASATANDDGIETIKDYFNLEISRKILLEYGQPKIISLNYTLANIPDIKNLFSDISSIMNDETIISVVTGYHPDQFIVNMFDYIGHDHLTYLCLQDFVNIAAEFDLTILDANRYEHKGGSLHVTLALNTSMYKENISSNVQQLLQRERWMAIGEDKFYKDLAWRIEVATSELNVFLEKNDIKTIPAVGASISTTYLMNQFGVSEQISHLLDDDKLKQGRFSPYFGKQVYPMSEASQGSQSYILLLAWQHTDRIIERLEEVGFSGKLIIPLPMLRVLDYSKQ